MQYIVKYKTKEDKETKEISYKDKENVIFLIKQLQRGIASIEGKIIVSDIESFDVFQIIYQNYDQKDNKGKCINIEIDKDGDPDIINCINPYTKDITNELLNERLISSKIKGNIYLEPKTISILGDKFTLKNPSKIRDIFNILVISNSKNVPFTKMEEIFIENRFKEINIKDFKFTPMRDLLKTKLFNFKQEIGKEVLTINSKGIIINI